MLKQLKKGRNTEFLENIRTHAATVGPAAKLLGLFSTVLRP